MNEDDLVKKLNQLFIFLQDKLEPEDMSTVERMFLVEGGRLDPALGMDRKFSAVVNRAREQYAAKIETDRAERFPNWGRLSRSR